MAFHKKTIRDIELKGKQVLLRADYNVPLDEDGKIADDYRMQKSLPTIEYLLDKKCSIVITSHLGRPEGKIDQAYSLRPVAKHLSQLLKRPVDFIANCVGPEVNKQTAKLKPGQIAMLENVRFHPEEEVNDKEFAKRLATDSHAAVFVQDCFGVAHRSHASIVGMTSYMPSVAGLLLEQEVDTITEVMENPKRPLMAIIGGAKIADKLALLRRFIELADVVAIGGAMANTFLLAEHIAIGASKADKTDLPLAKDILDKARAKAKKQHFIFYLPQDGVVASRAAEHTKTRIVDWDAHVIADVENYPKRPPRSSATIASDEMILDTGPFSGAFIAGAMQLCNTVIWNGTMGVTEVDSLHGPVGPFAHGTELVMDALFGQYGHRPFSLIGGGDTVAYIEQRRMTDCFNHVSTGGGASLELMAGKKLPGVEALMDKR